MKVKSSATVLMVAALIVPTTSGCTALNNAKDKIASAASSATNNAQGVATSGSYAFHQIDTEGLGWYTSKIDSATQSINLYMYALTNQSVIDSLIKAQKRGVNVRVLLDSKFGGTKTNAKAATALKNAEVKVQFADAGRIFHIKTTTFDGKEAVISTGNLSMAHDMDAAVVTTNSAQVSAIDKTFDADFTMQSAKTDTQNADGLVWSPGAAGEMEHVIDKSTKTISFSSEELVYQPLVDSLVNAARRGVQCRVLMSTGNLADNVLTELKSAGCNVKITSNVYVHEKVEIADQGTQNATMILGSQNGTITSLQRNRELGIELNSANSSIINAANSGFNNAFAG